ncbi:MAG: hypothetical protein OXI60_06185 [Acidiferrobacterales bacterium]|nr:hypothetical protein [Acidiferrobacterales bacterium]
MKPITQRQQLIYDYLREKKSAQSAYDILDAFTEHGLRAPSQIYRELKKLLECGLIHKVESLNAYIACNQEHDMGQFAVAICNNCRAVRELSNLKLAGRFHSLDEWEEFIPHKLIVEVKGRCSSCN